MTAELQRGDDILIFHPNSVVEKWTSSVDVIIPEEIEVRRSAMPTETEGDPEFNLIYFIADGVRQEAIKLFSKN